MSFTLEKDGKIYCDWRISVQDCEEGHFFWKLYLSSSCLAIFDLLFMITILAFRKWVVGEKWSSMIRGDTGSLALFILPALLYSVHSLLITLEVHPLIPGILWTFVYPSGFLALLYYLGSVLKALPKSMTTASSPKPWYPNDRQRTIFLIILFCFSFFENVIFLSLAEIFSYQGKRELARTLARIGFNFFAINNIFFAILFVWTSSSLVSKVQLALHEVKNVKKSQNKHADPLLALSVQKMTQNSNIVIASSIIDIFYFFVLGNYPTIFTNLPFSKALAVICTIVTCAGFFFFFLYTIIVDIQRMMHRKKLGGSDGKSDNSSFSQSMKNVTLKKESVVPSSPLVADLVDATIEELQPNGGTSLH